MSWIERINTEMIIKTGDGKEYRPNWLNANKEVQYNTSQFEFVNKRGTLVYRGKDKGGVYSLELYFQGENNIEDARAFEISARDSRPWEISHPIYDSVFVQPVILRFDNSRMNSTVVTGQVIETITDKQPTSTMSAADKITQDVFELSEAISTQFAGEIITTNEITELADNSESLFQKAKGIAGDTIDSYYNAFKTANAAITQATSYPLNAMRQFQTFINAPARFKESVESRIDALLQQVNSIRAKITNLTTRGDKVVYESTVAGLSSAMALAAVTDPVYGSVVQTLGITQKIVNNFNGFLADLDTLQSANGGISGYVPNPEVIQRLESITNFTVAQLKEVALNQRAEHTIILEEDSNAILLAHRFYGLDANDDNLNDIVNVNELGINQLLSIRKGTAIKYYI